MEVSSKSTAPDLRPSQFAGAIVTAVVIVKFPTYEDRAKADAPVTYVLRSLFVVSTVLRMMLIRF